MRSLGFIRVESIPIKNAVVDFATISGSKLAASAKSRRRDRQKTKDSCGLENLLKEV
jgi:hypothetical protein